MDRVASSVSRAFNYRGGIVIEDDVWIGANCVLLDGAVLRRGCVVGAGSLVRENCRLTAFVAHTSSAG